MSRFPATMLAAAAATLWLVSPAAAQLQITELMYNPNGDDESVWEWIEVRNTGSTDIDLDGAFIADVGSTYDSADSASVLSANAGPTGTTVVPAGGVAVLWDGFFGDESLSNYDDSLFREAWGLGEGVPLIATTGTTRLGNQGDQIGIWPSRTAIESDVPAIGGGGTSGEVAGVAGALVSVAYDNASPWPTGATGVSIRWSGGGGPSGFQAGENWMNSVAGELAAATSAEVRVVGAQINSTSDVGTPGFVQGGTAGAPPGLSITEVLYNDGTFSNPERWEWIEVYNNGPAIDFSTSHAVLDDRAGARLAEPNITSGVIGSGEFAILYNGGALEELNMQDAWGDSLNYIPVADWPSLNNSSEEFGLWLNSLPGQAYFQEPNNDGPTFNLATASLEYGVGGFPSEGQGESIQLSSIAADPQSGDSWFASATADGVSVNAEPVTDDLVVHPGDDIGSPGAFAILGPTGDYNGDGLLNAGDYTVWRDNLGLDATPLANRDPSQTGVVGIGDYLAWKDAFLAGAPGAPLATPEPDTAMLLLLAAAAGLRRRPRG